MTQEQFIADCKRKGWGNQDRWGHFKSPDGKTRIKIGDRAWRYERKRAGWVRIGGEYYGKTIGAPDKKSDPVKGPGEVVELIPHSVITSYMSRNVHCGLSNLKAVRQVLTADRLFAGKRKGFLTGHNKNQRRHGIAGIILQQLRNRTEYHNVLRGTRHKWGVARNPYRFNTTTHEVTIVK